MRVSRVSNGNGGVVSLDFTDDSVVIRDVSSGRERAARLSGGALVVVFGFAAVAGNAEDRGNAGLATVMWIAAGLLFLAGAGGGVWWLISAARDRRRDGTTIAAESVVSARSSVDGGRVTLSLRTVDGADREFSALGHNGSVLANQFAVLLSAAAAVAQPEG